MDSSTYRTLSQVQAVRFAKSIPSDITAQRVTWPGDGLPADIEFDNGAHATGSCIRCHTPPCIEYAPGELMVGILPEFPADTNPAVCPTQAISWPVNSAAPSVDPAMCVLCGLCARRCPVSAIHLDLESAHVNDEPNAVFRLTNELSTAEQTQQTVRQFGRARQTGPLLAETDAILQAFATKFVEVSGLQTSQFTNHLARNLLMALGVGAAMRRRGDTYVRMDLVLGPPGVEVGVAEVEFGAGVLDAPRNILDNIAVLVARYGVPKAKIVPLIVSYALPNERSEYWQIIKDVKTVLGISIGSVTVGALVVLVWNQAAIHAVVGDELYVDIDARSIQSRIETILGRRLNLLLGGYPGCLVSEK